MDFRRVVGHTDAAITGAALLGTGDALYRLDDERQAAAAWEAVVAAAREPLDLPGVAESRRRACPHGRADVGDRGLSPGGPPRPPEDKAEIAARLVIASAYVAFAGFGAFWGVWGASVPQVQHQAGIQRRPTGIRLAVCRCGCSSRDAAGPGEL